MKSIILVAFIAAALAGCAAPYRPAGFGGGFTETQLDTNVFRVSFKGNGYTSAERAEEMALLRSADLAIQHGFAYFVIVDASSRVAQGAVTMPTQTQTTGTVTGAGNVAYLQANTVTTGGQRFIISTPTTTNTIVCLNDKPSGFSYDAKFIYASLSKKFLQ